VHNWPSDATQASECGAGASTTIAATQFDRLVFFSYAANRTASSGTTTYSVSRPGGDVTFQITGTGSKSGEGFFAVPAGSTYPEGNNISDSACTGSGGTLTTDYYVIELHPSP